MVPEASHMVGLLEDLQAIPDVLFVVRSRGAVAEIRSGLAISHKNDWITLGTNDGPAHMHLQVPAVSSVIFVQEEKPQRTSYSVRFLDGDGERVLAAFFTKMYDSDKRLIGPRVELYRSVEDKWRDKFP